MLLAGKQYQRRGLELLNGSGVTHSSILTALPVFMCLAASRPPTKPSVAMTAFLAPSFPNPFSLRTRLNAGRRLFLPVYLV